MATASLMDFLAGDALTKLAQAYANRPGLVRPFDDAFYATTENPNIGATVSYDVVTASREAAKVNNPESPASVVQGVFTQNKKAVALGSREAYLIDINMISQLQSGNPIVMRNAQRELENQVSNFTGRFRNLRTNSVHSLLFRGKIDIGSDGEIQTSTSSPVRTIDPAVPTANKLTTDGSGSTFAIGDWSSASTDIPGKLLQARQYMSQQYQFDLDTIYYDVNVPGYLAKNTAFKEYLARNLPGFNQRYVANGEIPDILGFKWVPVYKAVHIKGGTGGASQTITKWSTTGNFLSLAPTVSDWWWQNVDCGFAAPTGLTSEAQLAQAVLDPSLLASAFQIRYGMHSYSLMNAENVSAKLIVADYHLPMITSPNAYMFGSCA